MRLNVAPGLALAAPLAAPPPPLAAASARLTYPKAPRVREGGRMFYTRHDGLRNQRVLCVVDREDADVLAFVETTVGNHAR